MKFLEEIMPGDAFKFNEKYFLATSDYKKGNPYNYKLCYNMTNGFVQWIQENTLVETLPLFTVDSSGNIVPIKETPKDEAIK